MERSLEQQHPAWLERLGQVSPYAFVSSWLLLNLLQAALTDVHNDESYYWVYTQQLQWGYYDHPPMVALWIEMGQSVLAGELGLRLIHVLTFSASLLIWLRFLDRQHYGTYYVLLLSMPFLNYLSFMVFPDGPLLFFFSGFVWSYFRYHEKGGTEFLLLMSLTLSGMLYSKYHAVLVVPMLFLVNWRALGKPWPYVMALIALLLYLPHLWWQYAHGFPSFQFHTVGRATAFDWKDPVNFIVQQSLILGPVIFMAFAYRSRDFFEQSLKALMIGFYLFFFLASIRGVVHTQWTSVAYFPALILACRHGFGQRRWWLAATVLFVFVTGVMRLQLMFPLLPGEKMGPHYIHGQEVWAKTFGETVGDATLVFEYDLKEPSIYSFYSGKDALALFPGYRKRSQYDLWSIEDTIQGKPAVIARKYAFEGGQELRRNNRSIHWQRTDELVSFQNIRIQVNDVNSSADRSTLTLTLFNHREQELVLPETFRLFLRDTQTHRDDIIADPLTIRIPPGGDFQVTIQINQPLVGTFRIGIRGGLLSPSLNSDPFIISVHERGEE